MRNKSLRSTQKLLLLTSKNLTVHFDASTAFVFWQQHRLTMRRSQLVGLDDYYCPTLRLCMLDKDNYQFFNNFARIDDVMRFEDNYHQLCLTAPERSHDIEWLAWCDALNLSRMAGMNHPALFQTIYNRVPKGLYVS